MQITNVSSAPDKGSIVKHGVLGSSLEGESSITDKSIFSSIQSTVVPASSDSMPHKGVVAESLEKGGASVEAQALAGVREGRTTGDYSGGSVGGGSNTLDALFEDNDEDEAFEKTKTPPAMVTNERVPQVDADRPTVVATKTDEMEARPAARYSSRIQIAKEQDQQHSQWHVGDKQLKEDKAIPEEVGGGGVAVQVPEVRVTTATHMAQSVVADPEFKPVVTSTPTRMSVHVTENLEKVSPAPLPNTLPDTPAAVSPLHGQPYGDEVEKQEKQKLTVVGHGTSEQQVSDAMSIEGDLKLGIDDEEGSDQGEDGEEEAKAASDPPLPVFAVVVEPREERATSPPRVEFDVESVNSVASHYSARPAIGTEEYQTATQALEKRISFKSQQSANQESSDDGMSVGQKDIAAALKAPAPKAPPLQGHHLPVSL